MPNSAGASAATPVRPRPLVGQPKDPRTLKRLLEHLVALRESGDLDDDTWEDATAQLLAQYHLAAYAHGAGVPIRQVTPAELAAIQTNVDKQLEYLKGFKQAWRDGRYTDRPEAANRRTDMYADATTASWWMGHTRGYPLPAYPGDGTTQCKTKCHCSWDIQPLDGEGNADAYWRLGPSDHCQTCLQRSEEWSPVQIRDGELQLDGVTTKGWVTIHGHPVLLAGPDRGSSGGGTGGGGSKGLVSPKVITPTAPVKSLQDVNAALKAGTITRPEYTKQAKAIAKQAGTTKDQLETEMYAHERAVYQAKNDADRLNLPIHVAAAAEIYKPYSEGKISLDTYTQRMSQYSKDHGVSAGGLETQALQSMGHTPKGMTPELADEALKTYQTWDAGKMPTSEYSAKIGTLGHVAGVSGADLIEQGRVNSLSAPKDMQSVVSGGRSFQVAPTETEAHAWGNAGYEGWAKQLSKDERKAIGSYSRKGDEPINSHLRFETPATAEVTSRIASLDQALGRSTVPSNIQVHRGFENPELIKRMESGTNLAGTTYKDDGYVSTGVAASGSFKKPIVVHINVPAGSKGAYIASMSKFPRETELLLPRGSNFKISGYRQVTNEFGTHWELDVDYTGQGDVPGAFKAYM